MLFSYNSFWLLSVFCCSCKHI